MEIKGQAQTGFIAWQKAPRFLLLVGPLSLSLCIKTGASYTAGCISPIIMLVTETGGIEWLRYVNILLFMLRDINAILYFLLILLFFAHVITCNKKRDKTVR